MTMANGPKGERRPADVNARAVMIAKIAIGEIKDVITDDGKNAAAVALGRTRRASEFDHLHVDATTSAPD